MRFSDDSTDIISDGSRRAYACHSPGKCFQWQVSFLKTHPDVDILGTALIEIDEDGHELFKRTFPKSNADVLHYIHKASPLAHPTVCFRRSALDALGAYPVGKCRCEDLALWFDCIEKGFSICNLDNPLLYLHVTDSLYKRRRAAAVAELLIYWKGILRMQGFTWRLLYPPAAFSVPAGTAFDCQAGVFRQGEKVPQQVRREYMF